MAGSSPLPKGLMPMGHKTALLLHGSRATMGSAGGSGVWPHGQQHVGVGLIPLALPIWHPLSLLTSCHLVLCPCRVAGTRSYRCHCHRLSPGHLCACGLGHHHAEKVLCLLNSIKDFSVTHSPSLPSAAPAAICPGSPGTRAGMDTAKGTPASVLCSRAVPRCAVLLACGSSGCTDLTSLATAAGGDLQH